MLAGGGDAPVPVRPRVRVQFRPGTVGIAFAPAIPAEFGDLTGFECVALDAIGLAIDRDSGSIGGMPTVAGEHDVMIHARRGDDPAEIDATIIVNADPRSLWRTIDPPTDAPHPKPHVATVHLAGDLTIVGASKRGRSHAHVGGFREDHLGARVVGPWHLLAVADGAGSAALSRLGSQLAVETALDMLEAALLSPSPLGEGLGVGDVSPRPAPADRPHPNPSPEGEGLEKQIAAILTTAARAAAQALEARAAADAIDPRTLSTTLILAAVHRVDAGIFTAALGIGDGGAGIVDIDRGSLVTLTTPDGGDYAGQTRFLEAAACDAVRVRTAIMPASAALLLMTDGISDPHLPTEAAFADPAAWTGLWQQITGAVDFRDPTAADQLLAWLDFWSHGNHDDRTLLVLLP